MARVCQLTDDLKYYLCMGKSPLARMAVPI